VSPRRVSGAGASGPLRALIVDDEPLARTLVRVLLEGDPEVVVAGECSGVDAAAEAGRTRPDILFLDVQMPEVDGFEVLARIGADKAPVVVFVTAYDQYAVRAFEVHALDYLLKPIDEARFREAVARSKLLARARRGGAMDPRLGALLDDHARHARRFLVRTREKTVVVDADRIDWIEAADYYATLHVGGKAHLLRETLTELERRLDPRSFFRVHRSAIVNLERVREIHSLFRGDCELVLRDGTRVRLSRTRRQEFQRLFAEPPGRR
jgi:two-component system, LytTR family, response regulator